MPYRDDALFGPPLDRQAMLWRYMDFAKFVSLLETQALYFARSDRLGNPIEGSSPLASVQLRLNMPVPAAARDLPVLLERFRWLIYVNCWHANRFESAAMWRLYLSSGEGVAVQSTVQRLADSLSAEERNVNIAAVRYIDYASEPVPSLNALHLFVHKRRSFEHEREVRAITMLRDLPSDREHLESDFPPGLPLRCDPSTLVQRVYVAPTAPNWFADLVRSVLRRYGMQQEVAHSSLSEAPLF